MCIQSIYNYPILPSSIAGEDMGAILSGKTFAKAADPMVLDPIIAAGYAAGGSSKTIPENLTLQLAIAAFSGASQSE